MKTKFDRTTKFRWAIGSLALVLMGTISTHARADWQLSYEFDEKWLCALEEKTTELNSPVANTGGQITFGQYGIFGIHFDDDPNEVLNVVLGEWGTQAKPYGGHIEGRIRAKWTPSADQTQPPEEMQVKVKGFLRGTEFGSATYHPRRELSLQTDPSSSAKWELKPKYYSSVSPHQREWGTSENGETRPVLLTLKTNGGHWDNGNYIVDYPFKLIATNAASNHEDGESTIKNEGYLEVQRDTRSVSLSRADAINEYNTNENGVPVIKGDTTYTSNEVVFGPNGVSYNGVKFDSAYHGNWSRTPYRDFLGEYDTTWNWAFSGAGLEDGGSTEYSRASRVAEEGNLEWVAGEGRWRKKEGTSPKEPKTVTVKYFARDNQDQTEAEARYELTLHEPIEISYHEKTSGQPDAVVFPVVVQGADGQSRFRGRYKESEDFPAAGGSTSIEVGTAKATTRGWAVGTGLEMGATIMDIVNVGRSYSLEY